MLPKRIGVFINYPEGFYQQHVLTGLLRQCQRYEYDLLVFSAMVEPGMGSRDYVDGEFCIFSLADFSHLDALVLVSIPMHENTDFTVRYQVEKYLKEKCTCPVVVLDMPVGDYPVISTDDTVAFSEIAEHMLDVHGLVHPENWYVLQGDPSMELCASRIKGIRRKLSERGLKLPDENIFPGDFWYTGGKALAERIISGELKVPQCIIALSDYMAIGLITALTAGGIRVPEDVKVIAYDGTQDGFVGEVPLTSYIPRISMVAQRAINHVRKTIEPEAVVYPAEDQDTARFSIGESCGCPCNYKEFRSRIRSSLLLENRDFSRTDIRNNADLWNFMQSYMIEGLTTVQDLDECLHKVSEYLYLINPFDEFYLCMRPDWEDRHNDSYPSFPPRMRCVLYSNGNEPSAGFYSNMLLSTGSDHEFDTASMLPALDLAHRCGAYYFMPLHYGNDMLGYSVIKSSYEKQVIPTSVHRNFMRNLNNSMRTVQAQTQLKRFSYFDSFTGMLNRRGMELQLSRLLAESDDKSMLVAYVIDMDGLKYINDSFGHQEGDYAIKAISNIIQSVTGEHEIAIRAGGDEFFVLCVGNYTEAIAQQKADLLIKLTHDKNETSGRPYRLGISVGWCMRMKKDTKKIESLLHDADIAMYRMKSIHKFIR